MALVIFCVAFTEAMRLRSALRLAMQPLSLRPKT